jgi:signal transduction histidine kinase
MLDIQPRSLTEVTRRAVNLATAQAAVRAEQVSITFESSSDLIVAQIDAPQIEDAVLNLIINAIEASEGESHVTVRIFRSESDDDATDLRDEATIEVSDQGSGISEADLDRIFHPFFTTRKVGTGLGLPAVRRIVRAHGGRVDVKSTVGEGSTFAIHLPLVNP